jgi:hypothetical protein
LPRREAIHLVGNDARDIVLAGADVPPAAMSSSTNPNPREELDLELPELDGEDVEAETESPVPVDEDLDAGFLQPHGEDGENPFDDATAEEAAPAEVAVHATEAEGGWLEGAEDASNLDVGPFDVVLQPEGKILEDDEADGRGHADDVPWLEGETFVADAGEEGPLAEDDELREEDLPALDADEDGEVADEELYDRAAIAADDELRWDDRAWARVAGDHGPRAASDEHDDSERLPTPSEGPTHLRRDATWKSLDDGGRVMAAGFVPGDSVVLALATPDRARAFLVRVQLDGEARIIAEVDPHLGADDDGTPCIVTFLRWDDARGCLFVGGNFGVEAYRPA